ncbi:hypothetical protein [Euzebya sp.]|uniref:hypothetical protein n=1 Tax=Euzebya sp. TaxID=1971409 RepID=UPI003517D170
MLCPSQVWEEARSLAFKIICDHPPEPLAERLTALDGRVIEEDEVTSLMDELGYPRRDQTVNVTAA